MLSKTGPVKPNTIREIIVFRHWQRRKSARLMETLLGILSEFKSDKIKETFQQYHNILIPANLKAAEKSAEDSQDLLKSWLSNDKIPLSEGKEGDVKNLPPEWSELLNQTMSDESVPTAWRGKKVNYGRRKNKISS